MKTPISFVPALTVLSLALCACSGENEQDDPTGQGGSPTTDITDPTGDGGSAGAGEGGSAGGIGTGGGGGSAGGLGTGGSGGSAGSAGTGGEQPIVVPTVDPDATPETKALFFNLKNLAPEKTLIGMQNATTSGNFMKQNGQVSWGAADGVKSDIREICDKGPGVTGFDVAGVVGDYWITDPKKDEYAANNRKQLTDHIKKIYGRGGVVTMSWHQANHITNAHDAKHGPHELWQIVPPEACDEVEAVAPNVQNCGAAFENFKKKVKVAADFFEGLKDDNGTPIPIVFRPFHENSGGWFWWGADENATPKYKASLRAIWSWMVRYMKDERQIHQLLWSISPNGKGQWGFMDADKYVGYSPGMDLVDVLGYDYYDVKGLSFAVPELKMLVDLANANGKISAMTEGGTTNGVKDDWGSDVWSKTIVGPILDDEKARGVAWILFWYNHPTSDKWGPFATHKSAADFAAVCDRPDTLLEGEVNLYAMP